MRDSVDANVDRWLREIPTLNPLREQVIARLSKIARHISADRSTALTAGDLAIWQFKTLLMLRRAGTPHELSPSQLADQLGLTRGALSARLTGLEERGLIVREHDAGDRRRVRVRLTPAGTQALEAQRDAEERNEDHLLSALTEPELHTLADLLRKIMLTVER
ncbi:MAG TPA: MarR family transcriptional regulator [Actinophytocola sp.]|uniref:MarR family winged helix-turn-helix transcriptional regulator n=1 Tax=Actinophytocola sp. TaxID=1872138 RepID=UPI002DB6CE30|nr:MarR family transcriptional regulator [Actinophytocola sp.]HEU5474254.1 MarR family transcriptional regulator [Actinophytocola sp.]